MVQVLLILISGMRIRLITILVVLLFQEQLVLVIHHFTTVGITYYYCVVTQPASGCESVSVTAEVDIVPGPTTTKPQDDQACVGAVISY